ncbi:MAG TPA: HU family DNA-binding protein [Microvirga sp.]|nr:HU family DNA-binding protein [Microvirga sp.]
MRPAPSGSALMRGCACLPLGPQEAPLDGRRDPRLRPLSPSRRRRMNKGELVNAMAEKVGLTRAQAGEALDAAIDTITEALKKGEEVKIVGFGTFVITDRAAGEARNPRTGEKVQVPASKSPKFRAGAGLKDAVNG